MRRLRRLLALGAILAPSPAHAQDRPGVQRADSGVVFDFQAADLRVVISALADVAGLNIVYGDLPQRPVTLRTSRAVPPSEVRALLLSVAEANGLAVTEEGGLLRVFAAQTAPGPGPRGAPGDTTQGVEPRRLFVHRLRHARAEDLAQILRTVYGLGGSGETAVARSGARRPLSEALREQRMPPGFPTEPISPGAQPAGPAERRGLSTGLRGEVEIVPDGLNNALLVLANQADYETLRAAIDELDARPLQVLIEVLIAEVRRDKSFDLGVDVFIPQQDAAKSGDTTSAPRDTLGLFRLPGVSAAGDLVLRVLGIGRVNADVVLRALASRGDVTIVSRPVILAQNNQDARILVGDQRPFVQLFRALPTDAAVRDQVVQYRNVGTQLSIRPTINADGYVSLTVLQEVSNATSEVQFDAPVISTREAETRLLVKDGHTAIIGGLLGNQREASNSGIPLLKDIPLLGMLFRSQHRRTVVTELFVLITPRVLRTDQDLDDATRGMRESARELRARTPPLDSLRRMPRRDSLPRDTVP